MKKSKSFDLDFFVKSGKKDILKSFRMDLNSCATSRREACISSKRSFVYHQGESLVYHHCERGYSLRLMIYTFGDEIHAKAWWYAIAFAMDKKIRQVETCRIFWLGNRDSNPNKQSQSLSCCRYTIPQYEVLSGNKQSRVCCALRCKHLYTIPQCF